MDTYYVDGKFVSEDKATLSVKDIAILRGYAVFDFLRTYNRRPFHLDEHIKRFENSARLIGLELRWTGEEIRDVVMETIARNPHHEESNIRIVATGGESLDGVLPDGRGKLLVMVTPKHELPSSWYTDGAKVVTVEEVRSIPGAKSTNYLMAIKAQLKGRAENAIEVIYVDPESRVLEGTTSNFFGIKGGTVVTPGDVRILRGITRMVLLGILQGHLPVELRDIYRNELSSLDEAFITASNKEIVPIVRIDNMTIGSGKPGPVTLQIMDIFKEYTREYGLGKK